MSAAGANFSGLLGSLVGGSASAQNGAPFGAFTVRQMARELAQKPFRPPETGLPPPFDALSYDRYRAIRFNPERALWRGQRLPFEVQLFHRGFLYNSRVDIFQVVDGQAQRVPYTPDLFIFDGTPGSPPAAPPPPGADLGFSGFRLHAPVNRPDYYDEVAVFQGASYFRAVGKGQVYGISSRGLSIKTADPAGEEFPAFRTFWIERPRPDTSSVVVHALLDSESATAAFRFTIRPGDTTVMDVEMTLYPRVEITQPGLATLTSMFFFDMNDRRGVDDFRPGVHDSDGLAMWNGRGERLWRPLTNPRDLQVSSFQEVNPRGFGLMQRQRDFRAYEDLEARYERRPSLWVEPIGDWGEGSIHLIEIPTPGEIHDNIVAFWRPREPMRQGAEYTFTYRLHWGAENPFETDQARVIKSRTGVGAAPETRLFVLDIQGGKLDGLPPDTALRPAISASAGKLVNPVVQHNPEIGGWRLTFELLPERNPVVELRAQLFRDQEPMSEVWIYRWTP